MVLAFYHLRRVWCLYLCNLKLWKAVIWCAGVRSTWSLVNNDNLQTIRSSLVKNDAQLTRCHPMHFTAFFSILISIWLGFIHYYSFLFFLLLDRHTHKQYLQIRQRRGVLFKIRLNAVRAQALTLLWIIPQKIPSFIPYELGIWIYTVRARCSTKLLA